jgi:hypothetical protein
MRVLGKEHPDTLTTTGNVAACLSHQGNYVEAEREVLGTTRRVLSDEHPSTLWSANSLAKMLVDSDQGKHSEAEQILKGVFATQQRVRELRTPTR